MSACQRVIAQLDGLFVTGELPPEARAHLAGCGACRDYYDHLFAADAALTPGRPLQGARLSPGEQALLLGVALPPEGAPADRPRWRSWPRLAAPALAAAVVLAALWLGAGGLQRPTRSAPALAHRGADGHAVDAALAPLGLRALCLERGADGEPSTRSLGVKPHAGQAPCPRGAALGFTLRNETARSWHLQLVTIDSAGATIERYAGPATPADDERPLPGEAFALDTSAPGLLRVVARFSPEPPPAGQLLAALEAGRLTEASDGPTLELLIEVGR